jgi:hypothetical protein
MPNEHEQNDIIPLDTLINELNITSASYITDISFNKKENNNFTNSFHNIYNPLSYNTKGYNQELKNQNDIFITEDVNIKQRMYDIVNTENNVLDNKTTEVNTTATTNDRDSNFLNEKSTNYQIANSILFYAFYICILGFLYQLFVLNILNVNIYLKIFIVFLLILYPFYINFLVTFFLYIFNLLHAFIMSQTYKDPKSYYDTSVSN